MSVFLNSAARNEKLISNLARDQKSLATPGLSYQSYQWKSVKGHGSVNFHTLDESVHAPSRTEILTLQLNKNG